jgi:cytidylate kinase
MSRPSSPLTPAEDAWVIDTSSMDANKLTLLALEMIEGKN